MEEILDLEQTKNPPKGTLKKIAIKYGLLGFLVTVGVTLITFLSGGMDIEKMQDAIEGGGGFNSSSLVGMLVGFVAIALYFLIYYLAVKEYRTALGGYITLGQGFKVAFLSVVIKALLVAIWTYVFYAFIHPSYLESMREMMEELMSDAGGDMPEFMTQAYGIMYSAVGMAGMQFFNTLTGGTLLSLLAAAIGQKKP